MVGILEGLSFFFVQLWAYPAVILSVAKNLVLRTENTMS
jgi:hypothetical protein